MAAKAVVGRLSTILSLNSSNFERGMKRARKSAASFSGSLNNLISKTLKWGIVVAAAAKAAAIWYVKSALDAGAATTKLAKRLDVSTEALGGIQHAAKMAGIETESLGLWLTSFSVNLSKARRPTSEEGKALHELGLSGAELRKLPLDKQIAKFGDALKGFKTAGDRARISMMFFGKGSAAMIGLVQKGTKGFNAYRREADALGLTFSGKVGQGMLRAKDGMDRFKGAMRGAATVAAGKLAPVIEDLTNRFVNWAVENENLKRSVVNFLNVSAKGFGFLLEVLDDIKDGVLKLQIAFLDFAVGLEKVKSTAADLKESFKIGWRAPDDLIKAAITGKPPVELFNAIAKAEREKEASDKLVSDMAAARDVAKQQLTESRNAQPRLSDRFDKWLIGALANPTQPSTDKPSWLHRQIGAQTARVSAAPGNMNAAVVAKLSAIQQQLQAMNIGLRIVSTIG